MKISLVLVCEIAVSEYMKMSPQKRGLDNVSAWKRSRCHAFTQLNITASDSPLLVFLAVDMLRWDAAEKADLWKSLGFQSIAEKCTVNLVFLFVPPYYFSGSWWGVFFFLLAGEFPLKVPYWTMGQDYIFRKKAGLNLVSLGHSAVFWEGDLLGN